MASASHRFDEADDQRSRGSSSPAKNTSAAQRISTLLQRLVPRCERLDLGLAERLPNRGFAVPAVTDRRWQTIMEARRTVEPAVLRLAIARGDLEWETRVRGAQHRLSRRPTFAPADSAYHSDAWAEAHRLFHRTLLDGCGNDVLLETFDRLWTASELARRWSVHPAHRTPERAVVARHRRIEQAAVARDPELAAGLLTEHLTQTAAALTVDGS